MTQDLDLSNLPRGTVVKIHHDGNTRIMVFEDACSIEIIPPPQKAVSKLEELKRKYDRWCDSGQGNTTVSIYAMRDLINILIAQQRGGVDE